MIIESKYSLKDRVRIIALEKIIGVVVSIWFSNIGLQYEVRYFFNGESKQIYLFDFEIEAVK